MEKISKAFGPGFLLFAVTNDHKVIVLRILSIEKNTETSAEALALVMHSELVIPKNNELAQAYYAAHLECLPIPDSVFFLGDIFKVNQIFLSPDEASKFAFDQLNALASEKEKEIHAIHDKMGRVLSFVTNDIDTLCEAFNSTPSVEATP